MVPLLGSWQGTRFSLECGDDLCVFELPGAFKLRDHYVQRIQSSLALFLFSGQADQPQQRIIVPIQLLQRKSHSPELDSNRWTFLHDSQKLSRVRLIH